MKHTELPWVVTHYGIEQATSNDPLVIDSSIKPENAEFIVRAVNNHYKLLNACKLALGAFENNSAIDWNEIEEAIKEAEK